MKRVALEEEEIMKRVPVVALLAVLLLVLSTSAATFSQESGKPLDGKIIALDAGHGGTELGATYPPDYGAAADIYEKDVNLAVVDKLREMLKGAGADVVLTREVDETIYSRRERVDIAIEKCMRQSGRKCDALVSVHHNGSMDRSYDGLLVIYNERRDLPLATATHDALLSELDYPLPSETYRFTDEGLRHGGYGITIYGQLVSVLTEAYYITNTWEYEQYSAGEPTPICDDGGGNCRVVLVGARTIEEAAALHEGLLDYFRSQGDDGDNQCPPGKQKQEEC
jgi:N-acetylmuramoyl-L-alanine amidase